MSRALLSVVLAVGIASCSGDDALSDGGAGTTAGTTAGTSGVGGTGGTGGGEHDAGDHDSGIPNLRACNKNSDCTIAATVCCWCGGLQPNEVTAIRAEHADAFRDDMCPPPYPCPAIYCPSPGERFVATCEAGTCTVNDLEQLALTECDADEDCQVRAEACCECGAETNIWDLVSVSDSAAFAELVCDADQACNRCAAIYPELISARCNLEQRCELFDQNEAPLD